MANRKQFIWKCQFLRGQVENNISYITRDRVGVLYTSIRKGYNAYMHHHKLVR